jgi:MSHA biogenesis protein MshP
LNSKAARKQRGFALVAALFVLVVLAALGAFAVRMNMTQQYDADLDLQHVRAEAALNAGIEFAPTRLLASAATNNSATWLRCLISAADTR